MTTSQAIDTIKHLYSGLDPFALSAQDIQESDVFYNGYIYDEMTDESYCKILKSAPSLFRKKFVDLGCGVGKKVLLTSLLSKTSQSTGIEILPNLYRAAMGVKVQYDKEYQSLDSDIEFIHADFTKIDFSNADCVYLSLTVAGMEIELTGSLAKKLNELKKGSILVTTTFSFPSEKYEVLTDLPCDFLVSPPGVAIIQIKKE